MNSEARQGELPVGPLLAAVGAVLLIVSLFLDWYEPGTGVSAFTVFEFLDLLLLLLAVATIASLAGGMGLVRPAPSPAVSLGVALFTVFVVASQIVDHPPAAVGAEKEIGIWLALSGSALMVAGAVLGYARISLAVESRPRERGAPTRSDHEAPTVRTPAARDKPGPEPGRPVASDEPDRP